MAAAHGFSAAAVSELIKTSPEALMLWNAACKENGLKGSCDPSSQSLDFVSKFLLQLQCKGFVKGVVPGNSSKHDPDVDTPQELTVHCPPKTRKLTRKTTKDGRCAGATLLTEMSRKDKEKIVGRIGGEGMQEILADRDSGKIIDDLLQVLTGLNPSRTKVRTLSRGGCVEILRDVLESMHKKKLKQQIPGVLDPHKLVTEFRSNGLAGLLLMLKKKSEIAKDQQGAESDSLSSSSGSPTQLLPGEIKKHKPRTQQ